MTNKHMVKGKSAIKISDSNKVINMLNEDNGLLQYISDHFNNSTDIEKDVILEICCQYYKDSNSFTKGRKELLNYILKHKLDWKYIVNNCNILVQN